MDHTGTPQTKTCYTCKHSEPHGKIVSICDIGRHAITRAENTCDYYTASAHKVLRTPKERPAPRRSTIQNIITILANAGQEADNMDQVKLDALNKERDGLINRRQDMATSKEKHQAKLDDAQAREEVIDTMIQALDIEIMRTARRVEDLEG